MISMCSPETDVGKETSVPQIEVTPEMIEAGKRALWPAELAPTFDEDEVVAKIYRSMQLARLHTS
jgi:hypothetical protein